MVNAQRQQGVNAGIGIRLLASCYDIIILLGIAILFVAIPVTISADVMGAEPPKWLQYLLFLSVCYAYFVGFWVKGGATTGMRPWKLMVAMQGSGDPLSWFSASIRFAGLMLTWLTLGMTLWFMVSQDTGHFLFFVAASIPAFSMLLMILGKDRCALHDLISASGVYKITKSKS